MRAVIQRVRSARVTVSGDEVGAIGPGLCVLVGVTHSDDEHVAQRMADKLWGLRVFDDAAGRMNVSTADAGAALLVVSQFTLYGDTSRGRRPSYVSAASPDQAAPLIDAVVAELQRLGATVATGRFGAEMLVELANDGPVTLIIEL